MAVPKNPPAYRPVIGTMIVYSDPFWVQVSEVVYQTCQALGDELIVLQPAANSTELMAFPTEELVDQILAHRLDAFICTIASEEVILALLNENLPVISLTELQISHPLLTAMDSLYDGGRLAGEFIGRALHNRGHAVCVTAGLETHAIKGQPRFCGFRDALQAYPGVSVGQIPAYWEYRPAAAALRETLRQYPHPIDAIFGVSDSVVLAARDVGRELGVVDEHTVLVGLNGDPKALEAIEEGSLHATVNTAVERLAKTAFECAHRAALGESRPSLIPQHFELITRDKVAALAARKLTILADLPTQMVGQSRLQLRDRLSQLEISGEITRQIGTLLEREQLFAVIVELVRKYYGYDWTRVLRWSQKDCALVFYEGDPSPPSRGVPLAQDWMLDQVYQSNEMIFIPDTQTSSRWHLGPEWEPVRSRAILPIPLGQQVIGVLDLQAAHPIRQATLEIIGLKLLASQIGIAIQNSDLFYEARQAREAAERANQLKTRLIANVGHEMRTPLNTILGFSQTIEKKAASGEEIDPAEVAQDVHYIYKSGEHLMYMINDLLDLSRAEIGALSLYFEPVYPAPFLKELFESFAKMEPPASHVVWKLEIPDNLPVIRADTIRLRQILANLMVNARKFTRCGSITLGAAVDLPHLHLWVKDTGQGIPLDLQQKIFEPFGVIGKKRRHEGIGLGLSISRHLVSLHEGIITLESQSGAGSTFHVYLPLPGVAANAGKETGGGARDWVLVITAGEIPAAIRAVCARGGLTPRPVSNREELVEALAREAPAAIAWDLDQLSNGEWWLVNQLSAHPQSAAAPLLLFGGGHSGQEAGLTQILFKPNDGNQLENWVDSITAHIPAGRAILIADDDAQARAFYSRILAERFPHCRLIEAQNGKEALAILARETPDLILLDLVMPEADGFSVLESVRGDPRTQRIPVVIISGKLLTYADIQRLNYARTTLSTKEILSAEETGQLLDQSGADGKPLPPPTSQLIKQGIAFIHQNYMRPLTRKDIAKAVGVSENYLTSIFRQETTLSPWDYLSRFRIQQAKTLLAQSAVSVTSIALQVGFNDPAYFSRVFHRQTGQSPLDFRQAALIKNS